MIKFFQKINKNRVIYFVERAKSVSQYREEIKISSDVLTEESIKSIVENGAEEYFYRKMMDYANAKGTEIISRIKVDQQKEITQRRILVAIRMLDIKLKQLIKVAKEKVEEERIKVARGVFVENQNLNMPVNESVQDRFRSYLSGMIGEEKDPDEWDRIAEVAKENFIKSSGIDDARMNKEELKDVMYQNPHVAAYVSGLIDRANMLFWGKR